MYLNEVFDQLSAGELAQTNLGEITEDKWPRVVMHLNLGLADLFKRFFLREGRLTLQLLAERVSYPMDMRYALANKRTKIAVDSRFILDSLDSPYTNDILKIERVLTEAGIELALNDSANLLALATSDTAPITLRVPADIVGQASDLPDDLKTSQLEVVYRARHPKIDVAAIGFDPERYDVRLPDSHLQALLYYVASRVAGPVGMGQTEGVTSINYWKRYEAECSQLTGAGVQLDRNTGQDKLRDRGFV